MNYLDYIILSILVIYGLWGLAKGFLRLILDLVGYAVAFLAAKYLSPYLVDYINQTDFYFNIQESLFNTFSRVSPTLSRSVETLKFPNELSDMFVSEPALRDVLNTYPKLRETIDQNIAALSGQSFMATLTDYIVIILCVVVIFLAVKILFSVITSIAMSRHEQMPFTIGNRILGMLIGLTLAVVIVSFTLQLVEIYALTSSPVFANNIAESKYAHIFTNIPLLQWLQNVMPH